MIFVIKKQNVMKKTIIISLLIFTALSCKAQNIVPLNGAIQANNYLKDLDNVRDNFVGTWQFIGGNQEFILHIYKHDMNTSSYLGQTFWKDNIIGNYIYKENGVEIINSHDFFSSLSNVNHTPFYGYTVNGTELEESLTTIFDYGKPYLNYDCETRYKEGNVIMEITNLNSGNPLVATFKILPIPHTIRTSNPACNDTNDISGFSIPTDMLLTKISDTPPPLN